MIRRAERIFLDMEDDTEFVSEEPDGTANLWRAGRRGLALLSETGSLSEMDAALAAAGRERSPETRDVKGGPGEFRGVWPVGRISVGQEGKDRRET